MITHVLKIEKQWAEARLRGDLLFEVRRNDRGFQKGDRVKYAVVDPKTGEVIEDHVLNRCEFEITYVLAGIPGIAEGYCVFSVAAAVLKSTKGTQK